MTPELYTGHVDFKASKGHDFLQLRAAFIALNIGTLSIMALIMLCFHFGIRALCQKCAVALANRAEPDQTARGCLISYCAVCLGTPVPIFKILMVFVRNNL